MTFRRRLTAFFAAIVLAPLLAGAVVVHALAQRQAIRDADDRLVGMEISALRILDGPRTLPLVERRVAVSGAGAGDGVVVGGRYLDRGFLRRLAAPSMIVDRGRVVVSNAGDAPSIVPSARFFDLPGGLRALCVCTGVPPSGIVLVTSHRPTGVVPSLPGVVVLLVLLGAILATLLALELARVLSKPHERALDRLVVTEHLSLTDALTGVPNRRHLETVLADEASRAARFDRPFSVLMIDVDRFKRINDTHGHVAGDRVLVEVAERIRRSLRTGLDTVARFGGEEFTAILPETGREGAMVVAEKLRSAVGSVPFGDGLAVTVSVGVACRPEDGVTPDELLRSADHALYEAKQTGRDRVVATP